jgi:hypothetical protein
LEKLVAEIPVTPTETIVTNERIPLTTMCVVVVLASLGVGLIAQDKPDFSGVWMLESGSSGVDIPQTLSVSQSLVRTNVRGEPIPPFFKDITVRRSLPDGTHSETYQIGIVGGTVAGTADGNAGRPRTHHRVAWEEQALVIESGSYTGAVQESGDWTERREVWSLDSNGRLHLAITTRSSVDASTTVMAMYRRQ